MRPLARAILTAGTVACAMAVASGCAEDPGAEHFPLHRRATRLLAGERPFDARLTGSVRYAPCRIPITPSLPLPAACAGARPGDATLADAARLAALARSALAAGPSTDATWAGALVDLATAGARPEALERAVDRLADVAARDTANAAALNDLAVAHVARASLRTDATDLLVALDLVERAAQIDSGSLHVGFNRAVILERLFLFGEAEEAWAGYARRDAGSEWAREARTRAAALERARSRRSLDAALAGLVGTGAPDTAAHALVRHDPQGARERVIDTLLPAWARATLGGDSARARRALAGAQSLAAQLLAAHADSSALHAAGGRGRAGDERAVMRRAAAVVRFAEGAARFRDGAFEQAAPPLADGAGDLRRAGARALAGWAEVLLGAIDIYRADHRAADARFTAVEREAAAHGELALRARALWGLGLSLARQGRLGEAEGRYVAASALFERLGERSNYGSMQSQLADVMLLTGREGPAFRAQHRALAALHHRRDPVARQRLLLALGRELTDASLAAAAVAVHREAARAAGSDLPEAQAEALATLASAEARAGRGVPAAAHLTAARRALVRVHDPLMRERLTAQIATTEAAVAAAPAAARERLTAAAGYFARQGIGIEQGPVLVQRAHLSLRLADTAAALADLATAAAMIDAQAADAATSWAEREMLEARRDVYHELVTISVARQDTARALEYAERARGGGRRPPAAGARVAAPGVTVLAYTPLADRLLVWQRSAAGARLTSVALPAERLELMVERFANLTASDADSAAARALGRTLFDLLVAPARPALRPGEELVVVTEGALDRLPFAALRDAGDGYLVERVAIRYASSLDAAGAGAGQPGAPLARAPVIVGDPSFDRALFPELELLGDAAREVADVAAAHPASEVVQPGAATRSAVTRALARASLFHFAGHARIVAGAAHLSHLVLARSGGGFGANVLYAADIARLDLRRVRLVVLSSCGTTQALSRRGSAARGLSEAFLAAGAGAVVSSLWEADDEGTAALMADFHRAVAAGTSGPEALRRAQLRMLAGPAHHRAPRTWGAFRYEGH